MEGFILVEIPLVYIRVFITTVVRGRGRGEGEGASQENDGSVVL